MIRTLHSIPTNGKKLNVCAYARVSADKYEAEMSLANQISYYTTLILENNNWEYCGVYADEGISGCSLDKRDQFKNMVQKAMNGFIDIILVKSISRFGRNITDVIGAINELRTMGVEVYFEKENISSLDATSTVALNLYAQLAESELKSMQENVKWSVDKRMKNGRYRIPVEEMLGYRYDKNGQLRIVEEEAKIIRLIFDMYINGITQRCIAETLMEHGYKTSLGSPIWNPKKVQIILINEKYAGDCLLHKEYNDYSTRSRRVITNRGEKDSYYVKDGHPAIISREVWNKACALRKERAIKFKRERGYQKPTQWPETSFGVCPYCGKNYFIKRIANTNKGTIKYSLTCGTNKQVLTCRESESIFIDDLRNIVCEQLKILKSNPLELKKQLKESFLFNKEPVLAKISILNDEIDMLKNKLTSFVSIDDDAKRAVEEEINAKIDKLTLDKKSLENELLTHANNEHYIKEIMNQIESISTTDFADSYRKIFKKVIIKSRTDLTFIIGNENVSELNLLNLEKQFKGNLLIKFRAQMYKVNFGVFFNA